MTENIITIFLLLGVAVGTVNLDQFTEPLDHENSSKAPPYEKFIGKFF